MIKSDVNNHLKVFEKNIQALSESLSEMFGKSISAYETSLRKAKKTQNRYLLIARNVGYMDYLKIKNFPIFRCSSAVPLPFRMLAL